jgi:hypothetical protein
MALLALCPLAVVQLGELAAQGAAELPPLRRGVLLVFQPQEHRLQLLRSANKAALTGCEQRATRGGAEKERITVVERRKSSLFHPKWASKSSPNAFPEPESDVSAPFGQSP